MATNWDVVTDHLQLKDPETNSRLDANRWLATPATNAVAEPIQRNVALLTAAQLRSAARLLGGRAAELQGMAERLELEKAELAAGGTAKPEDLQQLQARITDAHQKAGVARDRERELLELAVGAERRAQAAGAEDHLAGAAWRLREANLLRHQAVSAVQAGEIPREPLQKLELAESLTPMGATERPLRVQLKRAEIADTPDTPLWMLIREASLDLGFDAYERFMEIVLGDKQQQTDPATCGRTGGELRNRVKERMRLPFPDTDPYRFLKAATEVFMMLHSGVLKSPAVARRASDGGVAPADEASPLKYPGITFPVQDRLYALRRGVDLASAMDPAKRLAEFASPLANGGHKATTPFPYLAIIRQKLSDVPLRSTPDDDGVARITGLLLEKLEHPCLIELIWSYWHEEGMLVQAMNAISRRFQNIRVNGCDPLWNFELDPLRPLGNFLWGYIQDEQHRLSVARRAYEYDHQYGLALVGKAVPDVHGADTRSKFLEAFHNLLHLCNGFYKEDDDTTVIADGFPVLNALRELNLILSEGAGNQYGDLPWTARQEMLMQQWLLARPEMREFLPTRVMVAYPEPWMDSVDAMKGLMGWGNTSVMHFRELGIYGERLLLGARYNDWTKIVEPERAANWARFWRPEAQGYLHAYRAATGVDLSEERDATMPSTLLRQRLASLRPGAR